jgi:hypothetical protein
LQAVYAYEQSVISTKPDATLAVERLAGKLAGECPGVLKNAPRESPRSIFTSRPGARQQGEANRTIRQRSALDLELSRAVAVALLEPDRAAALAHARAIASLHWSSGSLTRYVHAKAAQLESAAKGPLPSICADMTVWVASDYKRLSPATRALVRQRDSLERSLSETDATARPDPTEILRSSEGPHERALARRIRRLEQKIRSFLKTLEPVLERLSSELGVSTGRQEREQPPQGAVLIARGTTAAGGTYTISAQQEPFHAAGQQCTVSLDIEEDETRGSRGGGFGTYACLSRSHPEGIHAYCNGTHWEVEGQTAEGATTASINLRGGGRITSPIALVPPSLGGPAGYYFQILPPSQNPTSLNELDAQGKLLATVRLPHEPKCPSRRSAPTPPQPLGGGVIVSGRVPHGPRFQILGERDRFMGRVEARVSIVVLREEASGGSFSGEVELTSRRQKPPPLEVQQETGCQPHEYAILYGLLKARGDTVLAKTSRGLKSFRRVHIPTSLHLHGVLAYIVLPAMPSEVIVRSPGDATVFVKHLKKSAREARETCEGEAETP